MVAALDEDMHQAGVHSNGTVVGAMARRLR